MSVPSETLQLLAKISEIALRHGGIIENAWNIIRQSLRAEVPHLLPSDLPHTDETWEETLRKKEAELAGGTTLADEDTFVPDPDDPGKKPA